MLAVFQATTPLIVALVVALLAATGAIALSRETPTRVAFSPSWSLGAWLVAGGALFSMSFMLPGASTWMIVTIRVVTGVGTCVVFAIMHRVRAARATAAKRSEVHSSHLPVPYLTGRGGVLSMPQATADVPLPYAA